MDGGELKRRFGQKIQELREARGLTQEQLADRIRRSVDTVSNIERGVNATRIETAYQLALALGVPFEALFDLDGVPAPAERERWAAIRSIADLLSETDPGTISHIRELIEVGLKLARSK